ncbi:hypothetical protein J27TS8_41010 [Robertmurraya siralis]|uniref:Uncharacterized protein n=1 Tax=Robertmurraya siralis TaxID=77777 RepID=A0A919WL49_9BACI|nr:hypothetical protein [Robertmurraya siralis]GIN64108.1 hypothetical protein J27TS8_41010 [Robertmurraya siralis]
MMNSNIFLSVIEEVIVKKTEIVVSNGVKIPNNNGLKFPQNNGQWFQNYIMMEWRNDGQDWGIFYDERTISKRLVNQSYS